MSELQEFQAAAVERICDQLNSTGGSRRFLLADEVGLGKTMVARGVIEELRRRSDDRKGSVCVYLCSNLEIAEQNRDKLTSEKSREPPTRLTLIPLRAATIHQARVKRTPQLFVFTPGTSLQLVGATGTMSERRMLLACLYGWRPHKLGAKLANWIEFFRCGARQRNINGLDRWAASCTPAELRREVAAMRKSGLYRKLISRWNQTKAGVRLDGESATAERYVLDALYSAVAELAENRDDKAAQKRARKNRNAVIGALRKGVAEAAIDFLAPDLILVDEFQRFKEVIALAEKKDELACRLFEGAGTRPRVLILSATPYKAVTFDHEQEDHYQDFRRTLSFLLAMRPGKKEWLDDVDMLLLDFKKKLTGDAVELPVLIGLKDKLERRLKEVMCRTERNRYIFDEHKGVEERPDFYGQLSLPTPDPEALAEFVSLRSFLQKHEKGERPFPSVIDFWKSCSSVISFMDAGYVLINRLKEQKVRVDAQLLRQESELKGLGQRNLKFKTLLSRLGEGAGSHAVERGWRFLWTRPTYLYYHDEFFGDADPTKFLVFSRWRFVPKAISFVVSGEFESASLRRRMPRRQAIELNSECLKVCLPLVSLADIVDPAAWSVSARGVGEELEPTSAQLRRHVRKELRRCLTAAGVRVVRNAPLKTYWPALFALERHHLGQLHAKMTKTNNPGPPAWEALLPIALETEKGDVEGSEQAKEFLGRIRPWLTSGREWDGSQLVFPAALLEDAVSMTLGSPAIGVMRATRSLFADDAINGLGAVGRICFQQVRSYFNKGYVQEVIRSHHRSGRYADQMMRYCFDAHFQAVIDEYAYLARNVLQRVELPAFLEHLGRAMAVGSGTPNINIPTSRGGRIQEKRSQRPVNFALAFGDESRSDESRESAASRKTSIRESFNSPFWPFVLATTSIGQEGLDFHLYCRDVMHWNLPSNPVDLEQREGRINRFDGLVVRRNIALDYPLSSIAPTDTSHRNVWARVFEEVLARPTGKQHLKHGLFPHWVFEPARHESVPIRIRRHLAIFDGSRDRAHYERLKKYLFYYRLAFGQARQQDLLDKIVDRPDEELLRRDLQACMINLSPFAEAYPWKKALSDARRLIHAPELLKKLIEETRALFNARREELQEVTADLESLWVTAERILAQGGSETPEDARSIAALIYLQNPFDEKFDGLVGHGLTDDVKVVRDVSRGE